ncbi:hypothetical protein C6P46_002607 [Rhodotorula mucilaginosa]|uniref:Uncharacterized protein n=1 Tax=Rhodotorula mucilaginosa TaxID=5537 RepID=A0A9P7BAG9_RHOMI|nr:hypothetical protein C6P46_002607 [Rhodotorula mucilaginosa]
MAETSVPGFVVALDANNLAAQFEQYTELPSWLLELGAMMWAPFEEWPHRFFTVFPDQEALWTAINALHLRPLPGPGEQHLSATDSGPTAFALSMIDQRRVLVRLAELQSQQTSNAHSGPDQIPPSGEMHGTVAWRGQVISSRWTEYPHSCNFRLMGIDVGGSGDEISRRWVKAIVEQGMDEEFVNDISYVFVRPGFPYTDRQNIAKYNLDFAFSSETRWITFMDSKARRDLIRFAKENMGRCSVGVGNADSIGRPPTFPERTKENEAYYAQAHVLSEQNKSTSAWTNVPMSTSTSAATAPSGSNAATKLGWSRALGSLASQKEMFCTRPLC